MVCVCVYMYEICLDFRFFSFLYKLGKTENWKKIGWLQSLH